MYNEQQYNKKVATATDFLFKTDHLMFFDRGETGHS